MNPTYRYRATVVRVIDADSLVLRVDLGFRVGVEITARLRGVDAPELSTPEGQVARAYVLSLFGASPEVVVESYRDRMSFARWIVDVWTDGESVAELLIRNGHAKMVTV